MQVLHPRLTIEQVLGPECHLGTTTISKLRCAYRGTRKDNLHGELPYPSRLYYYFVAAICCSQKH